jgi:hypothetical protein
MPKYITVTLTYKDGRKERRCTPSKLGNQCSKARFSPMPADDPNDALDDLTRQVNTVIETFLGDHPDTDLRIIPTAFEGDQADELRFAFVVTDPDISLPDPY